MAKTTLKSLSDALAARLTKGALPGELQGFGEAERAKAAAFVAATAETRPPGTAVMALEALPATGLRRRVRLAVVNYDMPFLGDSVAPAIGPRGLRLQPLHHPGIC